MANPKPNSRSRFWKIPTGARLVFKVMRPLDGKIIYSLFANDQTPGVDPWFHDLALCKRYAEASLERRQTGEGCDWIICSPEGENLGLFHLYNIKNQRAVLGYALAKHARGKGLAQEACEQVKAHLFRNQFVSVNAVTAFDNIASRALLEKTGFKPAQNRMDRKGKWITYRLPLNVSQKPVHFEERKFFLQDQPASTFPEKEKV